MSGMLEKIQIQRLEEKNNELEARCKTLEEKVASLEGKMSQFKSLRNEIESLKNQFKKSVENLERKDTFVNYDFEEHIDESTGRVQIGSDTSNNPLNFINDWEVIWAKRYDTEEERRNIKPGHEEGPFIIIDRDEDSLYGIYCTSTVPTYGDKLKSSYYIGDAIDCFKDSYIDFNKIKRLTTYHYVRKVDKISNAVRNNITKKLSIALQNGYSNYVLRNNSLVYYVKKNEIIQIGDKYFYVTKEDADYFYAFEAFKSEDGSNGVLINGNYYTFNFLDEIQIRKVTSMLKNDYNKLKGNANDFCMNNTFTIVAILTDEEERALKKYEYVYFNKGEIGDEYIPEIYDVVEFDDRLFYIFGEENNDYQIIELFISKNDCPSKGREEFDIDGERYYSPFEFLLIEKANEFEYITSSSDLDRYSMKSKFKYHRKQNRKQEKRLEEKEFKLKVIGSKWKELNRKALVNDNEGSTFVIINRSYNTIRVVNYCTLEMKDIDLDDYNSLPFNFKLKMKDTEYYEFRDRMKENDENKKAIELDQN